MEGEGNRGMGRERQREREEEVVIEALCDRERWGVRPAGGGGDEQSNRWRSGGVGL